MKNLLLAYLLLLIPAVISWVEHLRQERAILVNGLRAAIQVMLMGSVFLYFFRLPMAANLALVAFLLLSGSWIAYERGKGIPLVLPASVLLLLVAYLPSALLLFSSGVLKWLPHVLVPVSGMVIGNGTKALSLTYDRSKRMLSEYQEIVEAAFLDGADYLEAARFLIREAVHVALIPQIDGLKILGLVHIPGTMTGMLMGGMPPLEAAAYQVVIAYAIAATYILAAFLGAFFAFVVLLRARYGRLFRFREPVPLRS